MARLTILSSHSRILGRFFQDSWNNSFQYSSSWLLLLLLLRPLLLLRHFPHVSAAPSASGSLFRRGSSGDRVASASTAPNESASDDDAPLKNATVWMEGGCQQGGKEEGGDRDKEPERERERERGGADVPSSSSSSSSSC